MSFNLLALIVGAAATVAAYGFRLFTGTGALTALAVGAAVLLSAGWPLALLLVGAFASTAVLTHYRRGQKTQPEHRRGRTAAQVGANGIVAAWAAVAGQMVGGSWAIPAAVGAIAVTTADTWATEIGLLSRRTPRLITTGEMVARGRSGGITLLGTVSGVAGGLFVAALARLLLPPGEGWRLAAVLGAGVAGLLVDSLLGATVQARYRCPACGAEGESVTCTCGSERRLVSGWRWVTNDVVNVAGTLTGAVVAALVSARL